MNPMNPMMRARLALLVAFGLFAPMGCGPSSPGGAGTSAGAPAGGPTIGVAFETLQTEFWVAAVTILRAEAAARHITILEAVADGDTNKQFEQVQSFINRRVDGIILVPRDGKTVIPMIRAANRANIPVVLFNRPADPSDAPHTAVAPDNVSITRATVEYLIAEARTRRPRTTAAILMGDLSDVNAIGRRDGFEAAVAAAGDAIDVVARIPTDWNQEKALAGLRSAFQAHPDIGLVFTSSDFMLPSIKAVLSGLGRWKTVTDPGHVIVGGFDGDRTAYTMMVEGYVDATGVQDVFWESRQALDVVLSARTRTPPARIDDPGFAITQANLQTLKSRMWGAVGTEPAR